MTSFKYVILITVLLAVSNSVWAQTLTVTSLNTLDFGDQIFPGVNKSVNRIDGNAAEFQITGQAGRQVQITFQLPAYLNDSFNHSLELNFMSNDAGYNTSETGQATATGFDPHSGVITTLSSNGNLYIWLGGTVNPSSSQVGVNYANDIVINATYTN